MSSSTELLLQLALFLFIADYFIDALVWFVRKVYDIYNPIQHEH